MKWIKYGIAKIAHGFYSTVYEIKGCPLVIKKLPRGADAREELQKFRRLKETIGNNLPETSFVLAADSGKNRRLWVVQEKIEGPVMWQAERQTTEDKTIMYKQHNEMVRKCSSIPLFEDNGSNFIFDKKRKTLYYVDSFTGYHNS